MKPTLLIMAAGMGSRYGSLKQLEGLGPSGETLLDYSIYDAIEAGFKKIVFVIRESFANEFNKQIISKIKPHIECEYIFQELDYLPKGFQLPQGRQKPWGTGHAILVAKDIITQPFACINADDYYGKEAFQVMAKFLKQQTPQSTEFAMVGYELNKTLSPSGGVSRGVCIVNNDKLLQSVKERKKITIDKNNKIFDVEEEGRKVPLTGKETVSMNFWGFTPRFFEMLNESFKDFLNNRINEENSEFYIPDVVFERIKKGECNVRVLESVAKWFGVTYIEDKPRTIKLLQQLVETKKYPVNLWK